MRNLLYLLKRERQLFFANKIMVILFLGGPVLYGIVFGAVYTKGKLNALPVVVVDKDHTPLSARLIDMLDEADPIVVKEIRQDNVSLDKVFLRQSAYAVIVIPYRFQADVLQRRHPEVNTYINNTNLLASGYVTRSVNAVMATFNAAQPVAVRLQTFRLYNRASNYFMYIWPSYLAIILQSVLLVVLAMSFAAEWEGSAPALKVDVQHVSTALFMIAKLAFYWLLALVPVSVYSLYFMLFRQSPPQHVLQVLLLAWLFIITNSMVGMIAGVLFKSQLRSLQFLMILSLPVYISSGFSWPYDQDGLPAQVFSLVFPFMPFVNAFRILLIEQGALRDVADYLFIQTGQLLVYAIGGYMVLKINSKTLLLRHA